MTRRLAEFVIGRALALALLALVISLLADAAAEGDGVTAFDQPIWSYFVGHRSSAATSFFKAASTVGSTMTMGVLATIVVVVLLIRKARSAAITLAAVAVGAGILVVVGKAIVGRTRPPVAYRLVVETNQSFPSGHSLASAAILGGIAVLAARTIDHRIWRTTLRIGCVVAVLIIGVSRLYLGVHWSTDVLGGWLAGMAWLMICATTARVVHELASNPAGQRMLEPRHLRGAAVDP